MSTKEEKPVLQGQRTKTRKRDEKVKFDAIKFRDTIIEGLSAHTEDLAAANKFLDSAGSKVDYRTYGEVLFDILISGGILLPGGIISEEGEKDVPFTTPLCIFNSEDTTLEGLQPNASFFVQLMRRYKFLERIFEDEIRKILVYLKAFSEKNHMQLARCMVYWFSESVLDPKVLCHLVQEHLIKNDLAINFFCEVLSTSRQYRDVAFVRLLLRKSGLDSRLLEFLPVNRRSNEIFQNYFIDKGLEEVIDVRRTMEKEQCIKELQLFIAQQLEEKAPTKETVVAINEMNKKLELQETEIISTIWLCMMSNIDWNKKEDMLADQALRHVRSYVPLLLEFTTTARSELQLMLRVQEFCYDNMNFIKVFSKIVFLLYKSEVVSEEVIIKWYKDAHLPKGKTIFLNQVKKFIEWLQNAETESEESGEED